MTPTSHRCGYTLIEMLICVAILSIAFTGAFTATVMSYREGRFGAEDMMARQQTHLAGRALFRDIRNATAAPERLGEWTSGGQSLVLEMNAASRLEPAIIVYFKDGSRLMRRVEMTGGDSNTVALVENAARVEFGRSEGLITWQIEAQVTFQDQSRQNTSSGAARLGSGAGQ